MRHRKSFKKLGRNPSHRKALVSNVATALFEHKRIKTTTVKAKEIRRTVEKLITFAKSGSLADRRQVLRKIRDKRIVKILFDEIGPMYKERSGGYTRVIKLGRRRGDGAELALLELVGFEGVLLDRQKEKEDARAKKEEDKAKEEEEKKEEAAAE